MTIGEDRMARRMDISKASDEMTDWRRRLSADQLAEQYLDLQHLRRLVAVAESVEQIGGAELSANAQVPFG